MKRFFKKNNRKMGLIIVISMLIVGALMGCSSQIKNIPAQDIGEKIKKDIHLQELENGDKHKLQKLYGIHSNDVESFVLYTAPTNMKADEVLILKVKSEKEIETMKKHIQDRIEAQSQKFKSYLPDETFLVDNHVLQVQGDYILLAISAKAEQIEKAFHSAIAK
ncbi:DUF4358 domain-containing protein [Bacillus wiedmannii]|uniref:DUF4358 domain-containing protein n=1 Tax=Bacillus wiedmannii TaxID=1890302 RepID=UPI000BEB70E2|nr:DUF4358 domain-containing protein [Bacillus wiedmannii]PEF36879.1 hypothetical protein CON72_14135 [Bacillus wiedmannii]